MHHLERGLQGQLDELNLMIEEKNERVSSLEGESYELHQQVQECEVRLSFAESARADLEARVAEYKALWEEGAEKTQSMALAIEAKDERTSGLGAENHELQLRAQECELRLLSAESAKADLEARLAEYDVLWEEGIVKLQSMTLTIETKNERVAALERENEDLRQLLLECEPSTDFAATFLGAQAAE
jgi:chromosome segregation ATPase